MAKILLLNGPNLNLLGMRETSVYGQQSLSDIVKLLEQKAAQDNHEIISLQSNAESALIDRIHEARTDGTRYIIINAGALTHTSISLRDALLAVEIGYIEVHISNIHARESFRHYSYLSENAIGFISGLGSNGYLYAYQHIAELLK